MICYCQLLKPRADAKQETLSSSHEKRKAPRLKVQHDVSVLGGFFLLGLESQPLINADDQLTLLGHTRDLSALGLSLIVPSFRLHEQLCATKNHALRIRFHIPTGSIEARIAPVYCRPLDDKDPWKGYFLGAEFVSLSNDDRDRVNNYLAGVASSA